MWGVAFSPDGKTLATASQDKTVILWNGQPDSADFDLLLDKACNIANRNLSRREWDQFLGTDHRYLVSCPDLPVPGD